MAEDEDDRLNQIALQYAFAVLSFYVQEGFLLGNFSTAIISTTIRTFGISTSTKFQKGLEVGVEPEFITLFWMELFMPLLIFPASKYVGNAGSQLITFFGISISAKTCSNLWYLYMLRKDFSTVTRYAISRIRRDGASWEQLPVDELMKASLIFWGFSNAIFWWYQFQIAGNAPLIYARLDEISRFIVSKTFFAILIATEIAIRSFRATCNLTLNEVLWKSNNLITPMEMIATMDSEERMTVCVTALITTLEKAMKISSNLYSVLKAFSLNSSTTEKNASGSSDFSFGQLNSSAVEIRLLCVEYTSYRERPTCTLTTVPINQAPNYEAISYTWDDQPADQEIVVNDRLLLVTANARRIIEDRASRMHVRWLWIDAVCINQLDEVEKSFQVSIMGQIYSSAAFVTVWLENQKASMSDALLACSLLATIRRIRLNNATDKRRRHRDFVGNLKMWRALERLLSHPYWLRVWIIQELAHARKLQIFYGGICISGETFNIAMTEDVLEFSGMASACMALAGADIERQYLTTLQISRIANCIAFIRGQRGMNLAGVLLASLQAQSRDARDQIFGLYSIFQKTSLPAVILNEIKPNYDKNVVDLFYRIACILLVKRPDLVFNTSGIGYPRRLSEIPSWTTDWSDDGYHRGLLRVQDEYSFPEAVRYSAGGDCPLKYDIDSLKRLQLRGKLVGHISKLTSRSFPYIYRVHSPQLWVKDDVERCTNSMFQNLSDYHSEMKAIAESIPETYEPANQRRGEAIWRTMIGDRTVIAPDDESDKEDYSIPNSFPADGSIATLYAYWSLWITCAREVLALWEKFTGPTLKALWKSIKTRQSYRSLFFEFIRNATTFQRVLENTTNRGRFAITDTGLMATVPPRAKLEDQIYVIPGLPKPIVLRPTERIINDSTTKTWELVGDCYVHGLMRGEALQSKYDITELLIA